ncbi:FkbM family methyltransferase [Paenibacillus terreus]|uniref:FkbM family methyltransferase n=1 Tax=Paenibacillus terreus TaxID=1387834 RepID=A0ABV5B7Y0_9BACL
MHGTYIGDHKMLISLGYGGWITVSSQDYSLMPVLVTTGYFEYPLTNYFLKYIKAGDTVVDIGANIGYFTLLAARQVGTQGKVIGYEANPEMLPILRDNLAMNWVTDQVTLSNKAIYSENKNLEIQISERFPCYSSINERPEDNNVVDRYKKISIPGVTLDSELMDMDRIDLVKIDIEGGEYQAFLGMRGLIKQGKIKNISFEWNRPMLGEECEPFIQLLNLILHHHGGRLYVLSTEGDPVPVKLQEIISKDFYPFALIQFN